MHTAEEDVIDLHSHPPPIGLCLPASFWLKIMHTVKPILMTKTVNKEPIFVSWDSVLAGLHPDNPPPTPVPNLTVKC